MLFFLNGILWLSLYIVSTSGQCSSYSNCADCVNDGSAGGSFVSCEWNLDEDYCFNWYDEPNQNKNTAIRSSDCGVGASTVTVIIIVVVSIVILICCISIIVVCVIKRRNALTHQTQPSPAQRKGFKYAQPPSAPSAPQQVQVVQIPNQITYVQPQQPPSYDNVAPPAYAPGHAPGYNPHPDAVGEGGVTQYM